jgi:hypothetical protein
MLVTFFIKKKTPYTPFHFRNYFPRAIMLVSGSFGGLPYKKKEMEH